MGGQKQRWTAQEEEALRAGVKKHGTGKWKVILTDLEFTDFLYGRSNIDLKDKWRNMCSSVPTSDSGRRGRSPNLNMGPPTSSPNSISELRLLDEADLGGNASGGRTRVQSHKLGLEISPPSTPNPISSVHLLEEDCGSDLSLRGNSSGSRKRGRLSKLKGLDIGSPSDSTADLSVSGNTSGSRKRDKVSKFKRLEIGQPSSSNPISDVPLFKYDYTTNLSLSGNASGKRKRVRVHEPKALEIGPTSSSPNPMSDVPPFNNDCTAVLSKSPLHNTTALKYGPMILEALSSVKDSNGSDLKAIENFIEQRYELPENFRELLTSKLGRLVSDGALEKVNNCYKIKAPAEIPQTAAQSSVIPESHETLEDVARYNAYRISIAEGCSDMASKACAEAERVNKLAEDAEAMLLLAQEIHDKCQVDGSVYLPVLSDEELGS